MVEKMNENKLGLALGAFLSAVHAIWALLVAVIPAILQNFMDWIFELHSIKPIYIITEFNLLNAVFLVVITFIFGYAFGWLFAWIWNWIKNKK